jgi:ABC-2 type transport system ATP-binding protein
MIQVSNLTRYYGGFPAIQDVSFEVNQGEIIGLLGLNGAGKSTTMKILAGVMAPSKGKVTFDGKDVTDNADELKANIGFLPDEPPLYRDMTVRSFLIYAAQLKGMSGSEAKGRLPEVIRMAGLEGREKQIIGTLSHGFKKRVGIAMAVLHNPKLVILDEPISGLDPRQIKEMRTVIRRMSQGRAVIVSSHILGEIAKTCDRIVVLHQGKLVASGTQEELTKHLKNDRIVLTVRGDAETFAQWCTDHDAVHKVDLLDGAEPGMVNAQIELNGDTRESFLPQVAGAGFGLRLVETPQYQLEELFLGLTGGED